MTEAVIGVLVTVPSAEEGRELARAVVEERLAACGNVIPGVQSTYWWQGKLSEDSEALVLFKTRAELSPELRELCNEGGELIEESIDGVDRAAEIVRSVRDFSHAGTPEREEADLHALLDHVLVIAGPQMRGRIEVTRSYGALEPVRCAPQQLKQVFLNLVVNAIQAMEERGTLRIATRAEQGFAEIDVEDDGCGIPPEIQERIFDPFFTTKAVGEGTGLGLGIAYQIVSAHGGTLSVRSQPRRGSRFRVRLPMQGAPER